VDAIEKMIGSFSNYSKAIYPINQHIVNHLQKIWDALKKQVSDEEKKEVKEPIHPSTKQSLELALFHLFELLEKISFETPEQLSDFLSGVSVIDRTKILASRFFLKQNIGAFSTLIAQTLKSLNTKESKQRIIVSAVGGLNSFFGKKRHVTEKDMIETEEKTNILLSQILTFSTRRTIEKRYNFSPVSQIEITDKFLKKLKESAEKNYQDLEEIIDKLDLESSLDEILKKLAWLSEDIQNKQLNIKSNPDLSKNPRTLINSRFCLPIQTNLEMFMENIKKIQFYQKIARSPKFFSSELIKLKKPQDINLMSLTRLFEKIRPLVYCFETSHVAFEEAYELYLASCSFFKISKTQDQLQTIQESTSTHRLFSRLEGIIQEQDIEPSIIPLIQLAKEAIRDLGIMEAKKRYLVLLQEVETKLELVKVKISQKAHHLLDTYPQPLLEKLVSSKKIAKAILEQKSELKEKNLLLRDLILNFEAIEHVNFKFISTHDALELMQNFAYSRMIGPLEKLLVLLKKPYLWHYGVINSICEESLKRL